MPFQRELTLNETKTARPGLELGLEIPLSTTVTDASSSSPTPSPLCVVRFQIIILVGGEILCSKIHYFLIATDHFAVENPQINVHFFLLFWLLQSRDIYQQINADPFSQLPVHGTLMNAILSSPGENYGIIALSGF